MWVQSFRHANYNLSFDAQYAPFDSASSIHTAGFREARVAVYGPRICCSLKPSFVENGYVISGCQSQWSQIFYGRYMGRSTSPVLSDTFLIF